METVAAIMEVDADGMLHLPLPPAWRNQQIRVKAELELLASDAAKPGSGTRAELRGFGCLKGKIWMAADFDEPLEDFKEYAG